MDLGLKDGMGSIGLVSTESTFYSILMVMICTMRILLFLSQQRYIIMHLILFY